MKMPCQHISSGKKGDLCGRPKQSGDLRIGLRRCMLLIPLAGAHRVVGGDTLAAPAFPTSGHRPGSDVLIAGIASVQSGVIFHNFEFRLEIYPTSGCVSIPAARFRPLHTQSGADIIHANRLSDDPSCESDYDNHSRPRFSSVHHITGAVSLPDSPYVEVRHTCETASVFHNPESSHSLTGNLSFVFVTTSSSLSLSFPKPERWTSASTVPGAGFLGFTSSAVGGAFEIRTGAVSTLNSSSVKLRHNSASVRFASPMSLVATVLQKGLTCRIRQRLLPGSGILFSGRAAWPYKSGKLHILTQRRSVLLFDHNPKRFLAYSSSNPKPTLREYRRNQNQIRAGAKRLITFSPFSISKRSFAVKVLRVSLCFYSLKFMLL